MSTWSNNTNIMKSNLIDSQQIDQQRIFLKKLSKHLKLPYVRRTTFVGDAEAYLDGIIRDIKEVRRDCAEAVSLAKSFLKSYEALSKEYAQGTIISEEQREKLQEMNSELTQAHREIGYKEQRIEMLEREITEADNSYSQICNEQTQDKRTLKQLQKEIENFERDEQKKGLNDSIQKHLINFEINKENKEKIIQLQFVVNSKDAEIQIITKSLEDYKTKLAYEISTNEKNKSLISELISEIEYHKREAEEFSTKHKIAQEKGQNYEMEIMQYKIIIANFDNEKLRRGSEISMPATRQNSVFNSPSLGDMLDELDFEQREETPVMLLVSARKQFGTQDTFSNYEQQTVRRMMQVQRCGSVIAEGKECRKDKVRFNNEISNTHIVDIACRDIQVIDSYTESQRYELSLENQGRIHINPKTRLNEIYSLVDGLLDIPDKWEDKPTVIMNKENSHQVSNSETIKSKYAINQEGHLSIHSKEICKPVLLVNNRNHASLRCLDPNSSQLSLYKISQINIEPLILLKPLGIQSEKPFSLNNVHNQHIFSSPILLNPLNIQSVPSHNIQKPPLNFNRDLSNVILANSTILSTESESSLDIPYNQQQSPFISTVSQSLSIKNQIVYSFIPIKASSVDHKKFSQSKEFVIEITPKASTTKKAHAQSVLETQISDDGLPIVDHHKQSSGMTLDSSILSYQINSSHEDYTNSLIDYTEKTDQKKISSAGTDSCAKCIIF